MITLLILSVILFILSLRKIYIDSDKNWDEFNPYNTNVLAYMGFIFCGAIIFLGVIVLCIKYLI